MGASNMRPEVSAGIASAVRTFLVETTPHPDATLLEITSGLGTLTATSIDCLRDDFERFAMALSIVRAILQIAEPKACACDLCQYERMFLAANGEYLEGSASVMAVVAGRFLALQKPETLESFIAAVRVERSHALKNQIHMAKRGRAQGAA